jgi:hypothetical protein
MKLSILKVQGDSSKERIIRSIALVLIFAAVIWAFMKNNERVVDVLNRESAVYDETGTLDKEQRKFIVSFTRSLRDEYGLGSKIQVFGGDFTVPDLDSKTMYIGIAPSIDKVELRFPVMMRQSLGPEFIESLKAEHLLPSFSEDDWPSAIQIVLVEIFNKLDELQKGRTPSE